MASSSVIRLHHVANGTCTARLVDAAGLPGSTSLWADPLYDGAVPGGLSDDELLEVRARHLGGGDGSAATEPWNDLREWRRAIAAHDRYDELVLWYEHDLFDQLNLMQVLPWIREHVPAAATVSLVCVGSFPHHPHFKGLGELAPDQIAELFSGRERVGHARFALAAHAWDAFRASTPEALDDLRRGDTAALPFLAPALTRLLQEYPWTRDGLSRSERRLLALVASGPTTLATIFPRMTTPGDVLHMTDRGLVDLAGALAATSPPLLVLDPPTDGPPLDAVVALTAAGEQMLAGDADRVRLCGIDRWIGGVHQRGHAGVWRWDEAAQQVTRERL
ncbi:MAG: hypothetical protein AB7U83_01970 [Vicinamibacterales bacterium]